MKIVRATAAAFTFATSLVHAASPAATTVSFAALIGLDSPRAEVVDAILENAVDRLAWARAQIGSSRDETTRIVMRAAVQAILVDAERRLVVVLTPEELRRLKAAMAPPRRVALRAG